MWLPIVCAFTLLQAGGEEIIFRGYLLQSFRRVLPIGASVVIVSVLFSLIHGQYALPGKVSLALSSVFACWLAWRDDGLERAIGLHVGNNVLGFATLRGTGTPVFAGSLPGQTFGTSWRHPLVTILLIVLFVLVAEYVWPRVRRVMPQPVRPHPSEA
jgi:hypothetical protein